MTDRIIPDKNLINSNNGFYDESFHENLNDLKNAFKRIVAIKNSHYYLNLNNNEKKIIENYLNSYEKKIRI